MTEVEPDDEVADRVEPEYADDVIESLRAWLRNERRLGVRHWAVAGVQMAAASPTDRKAAAPVAPAGQSRAGSRTSGRTSTARAADTPPMFAPAEPGELSPLCDRELSETDARAALTQLDECHVRNCRLCPLHEHRTQTVFGVGRSRPEIVFVGEGPGADEDRQGIPFVGRAGQLLTRMIAAMGLTRDQVYIANVVKCRPPGNRTPTDDEMNACSPYLYRQLAILRPRVIVALGRPASQTLLQTKTPIGKLRGEFHDFPPPGLAYLGLPQIKLMPTFHPAYLLRSPAEKAKAWEDLKQVMRYLGLPIPRRYC